MNLLLFLAVSCHAAPAAASGLDGAWTLVRIGPAADAAKECRLPVTVRSGRFSLAGDSNALVLELGTDGRARRWDPRPAPPPRVVYPYTWDQWVRMHGDPVWPMTKSGQQWVQSRNGTGVSMVVPPLPSYVVKYPTPEPLTVVGTYAVADDQLTVQLQPEGRAGLFLVLERALPAPRRAPAVSESSSGR